jgi:mono/diheme cytochrome c family protein
MDASAARAAPKVANPVSADEANLVAGARLYRDHCTLCHGDPAHPKSLLANSLNPPAPQFMNDMPDMPENQNLHILEHGVRWTAMPDWKNVLNDQQIWQLVSFLSHMHDLSPLPSKSSQKRHHARSRSPALSEPLRVAPVEAHPRVLVPDR